ncbi:molybdate transport system permease protein [Deinococcus metallilatus]|uniref:Molybdenum transport system permease n=2 Tax=Deinococcus metallilatus TaxID=1211322 RepID=A0ABR6MX13_9DEIO|nr:molybdate transport system permease protein [Deinococcus metallilatus]GMA14310.1 molybdenum ABC transporter permease [Deinococcus metallilatus]
MRRPRLPVAPLLLGSLMTLFLLLPTLVVLGRGLGAGFLPTLLSPVVLDALRVSLWTTATTLGLTVLLVTPVAYLLARFEFPGKAVLDTLLDLPIVLPPVVAGVGLLLTFGRSGLLGPPLELAGISLAFSPAAVVLAQLFTSAPFYLRTARAGFMAVDREVEQAALTDGADRLRVFRFITWPLAFPFLLEGLVLTWARALGEFGATILFAGSLPGRTRTITLAIYSALESDLAPALVLSAVMVLLAFAVLLFVRGLAARRGG